MKRAPFLPLIAFATALIAHSAAADSTKTYAYDGEFEDATFAIESAILDRGLVIDYVSHVGDMLSRTKADVGGEVDLFSAADVYLFCSAVVSRKVMEVDPMNIAHCPYGVFAVETQDGVMIGHRTYPAGAMQEVEALLSEIAQDASEF